MTPLGCSWLPPVAEERDNSCLCDELSDIEVPTDEDGWLAPPLPSPSESELFREGRLEEESVGVGDCFLREPGGGDSIGTMGGDKSKSRFELELKLELELELALGFRRPPPIMPVESEIASAHILVEGPGLSFSHGLFNGTESGEGLSEGEVSVSI